MSKFYILFLLPFFVCCQSPTRNKAIASSPTASPKSLPKAGIEDLIKIAADTSQSYQIYVPKSAGDITKSNVIVFLDPQGSGATPAGLYRALAEQFQIVLIGSNSAKNGMSQELASKAVANLINDLQSRYGCNISLITLCGFSGGAKVALTSAAEVGIERVIYAGASIASAGAKPLHLLGFAGIKDMNYSDLIAYNGQMPASDLHHLLIEWEGGHEWIDPVNFTKAMYWVLFEQYRNSSEAIVSNYVVRFKKDHDRQIAIAKNKHDLILEYQLNDMMYRYLKGITEVASYQRQVQNLSQQPAYIKAMAAKNMILGKENREKQELITAFQTQDINWWRGRIGMLTAAKDASCKRLLGFVSLAAYSYSNQVIQRREMALAGKVLTIYELADPNNPDQLYFNAMRYAIENDRDKSLEYLQRAIKHGNLDLLKINGEGAFDSLRDDPRWDTLVGKIGR